MTKERTQRQTHTHMGINMMGGKQKRQTKTNKQGHGHSVFPPPIWHHVLGSYHLCSTRGSCGGGVGGAAGGLRVQGRNMLNHSNLLAKEPCGHRIKTSTYTLSGSIPGWWGVGGWWPWGHPGPCQMTKQTGVGLARTWQLKINWKTDM